MKEVRCAVFYSEGLDGRKQQKMPMQDPARVVVLAFAIQRYLLRCGDVGMLWIPPTFSSFLARQNLQSVA